MKPVYALILLTLAGCSPSTTTAAAGTPAPAASGTGSGPAAVATGATSGGTLDVTLDGAALEFDTEPTASLQANDIYMNFNRGKETKTYIKLRLSNNDRWKTPVVVPALTNGTQAQCEVGLGTARDSFWASRQGSGTDEGSKLEVKAGRLVGTWKYHSKAWQDLGGGNGAAHDVVVTIDMALPNGLQ